jgi:SAM-dependent methyltransferase
MAASLSAASPVRRALFVTVILAGSFLLFLVQPMVARMALPRLGGAPNVWNSAMLVYQALLLGGYAYAHLLGRFTLRRQAAIHLGLLLLAALTLPIGIAKLAPPAPGSEAIWVPWLFVLSIGPVFFLVSAQAPLMQRWFASHPQAGEPWALYAASNLGSFAGLIAYPLLVEPLLPLRWQSLGWSLSYGLLVLLIASAAAARWSVVAASDAVPSIKPSEILTFRRILSWLVLAAVPSGLMLSTTTHLTTDLFAMPLLWVIPLGLYLFSFVFAFADRRGPALTIGFVTPLLLLLAGGVAMASRGETGLAPVFASIALLFAVCVALHARLYDLRPATEHLTLFYLVMSAGGALGGLFTALIAPLLFDWAWEHPLLVFAAAVLLPLPRWYDWRRLGGLEPGMARLGLFVLLGLAALLAWQLSDNLWDKDAGTLRLLLVGAIALIGMLLIPWRAAYLAALAMLMLAQGGLDTIQTSLDGLRSRSYFGIYTIREYPDQHLRMLAHGTTLHGVQSTLPALRKTPISYYGPGTGISIVLAHAQQLYGRSARIGVVGLGTGTLACHARPGEQWHFYEIDPAVLEFSQKRDFTYLADCAPQAKIVIGDARLELAKVQPASFDVLAIDAFSSDAIPLHLLTDEALEVYLRALAADGLLVIHISNRFIELEPVLAAAAKRHGLLAEVRDDNPVDQVLYTPSSWVVLARSPARLARVKALAPDLPFKRLMPPAKQPWTDDHASILPYVRWQNLMGKP